MNVKKAKTLIWIFFFQLLISTIYGQQTACEQTMIESLNEAAMILNKPESKKLWGISLNAPIIVVDHRNNKMFFTSIQDGVVEDIKEEPWDNRVPLANSFFEYKGKKYVTIIHAALMGSSCKHRVSLLSHEIFHLHQNSLGIENTSSTNYHIDEVTGRALLRIEMKVLQQALDGDMHSLHDAFYIRDYRQSLYPENNEDLYELNEGLAEYTGMRLSPIADVREHVKGSLNYTISKGYSNAFGYLTGAAYAIILDETHPQWRLDKDLNKGLEYLIKKVKPEYADTADKTRLEKILVKYDYKHIISEEEEELKSFGNIDEFEELLNPQAAKLCIENNDVNFTYNPHDRIIALNNAVLLRNINIAGQWGKMRVESGIVRLNDWSAFYLLPPKTITTSTVAGDDYEIQINEGWKMVKEGENYKIIPQS